jgi:hypothetical protein
MTDLHMTEPHMTELHMVGQPVQIITSSPHFTQIIVEKVHQNQCHRHWKILCEVHIFHFLITINFAILHFFFINICTQN